MAIVFGDADTSNVKVFEGPCDEEGVLAYLEPLWKRRRSAMDNFAALQSREWGLHTLLCLSRCPLVATDGRNYQNIELRQIYVEDDHRRRGHCDAMIQLLERVCERLGVKLLVYEVHNEHMKKYLEKRGYSRQEFTHHYYR